MSASAASAAVEAVGAELALGQSDGLDQGFEFVEAEGGEAEPLADDFDQLAVFGRVGGGVACQVLVGIAFQFGYDAAGDEFHVALGGGEADVGTAVDEGRTGNAHVYFAHTVVEQYAHVVAQLRAAHDAVVAEEHALAAQQVAVGNELHLGHQRAHLLIGGGEAAGPGGRVFRYGALVGLAHTGCIAECHAYATVGDATDAVDFGVVLGCHHPAVVEAHFLDIAPFVGGGGEAVVDPQEGAYLFVVLRGAELFDTVGTQAHNLAWSQETVDFVVQIGEGCALGGGGIGSVLLANHDGGAAPVVAGGDDAVFGEQQHGAGAVDVAEHVFDAFDKGAALNEQQGDKLGLVGLARRQFGEVHGLFEQLLGECVDVVDLGYGDDSEASEVGVDDQGLGIGVADDAYAGGGSGEAGQGSFELAAEVGAFEVVDGAGERVFLSVVGGQTAASGAQV